MTTQTNGTNKKEKNAVNMQATMDVLGDHIVDVTEKVLSTDATWLYAAVSDDGVCCMGQFKNPKILLALLPVTQSIDDYRKGAVSPVRTLKAAIGAYEDASQLVIDAGYEATPERVMLMLDRMFTAAVDESFECDNSEVTE